MKEDFKNFVNNHKELINYVNTDKMTWQKFYDMYSLYGENSDVWDEYLNKKNNNTISLKDILDSLKNLDADEVQKNINSLNKILSLVSTLISKDNNVKEEYEPMPLYKKFED